MSFLSKKIFLFSILFFVGCSSSRSPLSSDNSILIGLVVPLSGSEAAAGESIRKGVELKVRALNAKGGVVGKKIELIVADDRGKAEDSALAATQLITQKKVEAIIGTLTSTGTLAMAPIAEKYNVPLIAPTATHPKVTTFGKNIFRVCFMESIQAQAMARFALEDVKIRRVAILYDAKSDYSLGLKSYFSETFKKGGGTIVDEVSFSAGDVDFKSQLTRMRTKRPDGIFIPAYYTEAALIARQARELDLNVVLLGGDGWDSPRFLEIAGMAASNSFFSNHYSKEDSSEEVQGFLKSFHQEFKEVPDAPAALGYDSMGFIARALQLRGNKSLRDYLAATQHYPGVTGVITMDENRDAVKSVVILKSSEGKFRFHKRAESE